MTVSTDARMIRGSFLTSDLVSGRQGGARAAKPVVQQIRGTTAVSDPHVSDDTALTRSDAPQRTFSAPIVNAAASREVHADSTPWQIWEGTVCEVNRSAGVMQVVLDAKIGQVPRHTGEIDLDSVSAQDQDLVRPGAVFYLTLYKRTLPSVENVEELRFRRRPSWSAAQLKRVEEDASMILSKMRALPTSA